MQRVAAAVRAPGWSVGIDPRGRIMATSDAGEIGMPWIVVGTQFARGLRVSLYQPGDDLESEGESRGEVVGNARELSRQLRELLGEIVCS